MTPDQLALEVAADALLEDISPDPERPVYTERQLARKTPRLIDIQVMVERSFTQTESLGDEIGLLASVGRMTRENRRCLKLWIDGWSQREIAEAFEISQQFVSQRLRKALRACYDSAPISFRRFSHHTIY